MSPGSAENDGQHESNLAQEKVPWQLFNRVANDGSVLVLAGLRTPWQREDTLSEELVDLQRRAILSAQSTSWRSWPALSSRSCGSTDKYLALRSGSGSMP